MKKFIVLFVIVMCLLFVSYDKFFSFFAKKEGNILASVNGEIITLEEVETLYDMRNVHLNSPAPDVERVEYEYARILYNRIKQIFISQELKKRNVQVSEAEVKALENVIKESYADVLSETLTFEKYLEENGIDYGQWIKQIYSQIENDKLQALLLEEITLSSEETLQYAEKIKAQKQKEFEHIRFFMIKGKPELLEEIRKDTEFSKENLGENAFSRIDFVNYFEEKGAMVFQSLFDSESLPEQYKKVLVNMEENTFSDILTDDDSSYILYLVEKKSSEEDDAVDLYLIAEEQLLQEKLPKAFDQWIAEAIARSDIFIVDSFNPKKIKRENDANKIGKLQEMLIEIEN